MQISRLETNVRSSCGRCEQMLSSQSSWITVAKNRSNLAAVAASAEASLNGWLCKQSQWTDLEEDQ